MKQKEIEVSEDPSPDESMDAVNKVVSWSGISGSERLRGLIAFLVEETLQGRGDNIRAKTIALDHYGYTPEELVERESVVRVDAGRLRRKLEDYYRTEGSTDPVSIVLPKGSYKPQFVKRKEGLSPETASPKAAPRKRPALLATALAAILVLALAPVFWFFGQRDTSASLAARAAAERVAVFDVSPSRLQAINLAESGRDLIFPAINPERVKAALAVFEAARDTDPEYAGGYAGIAQTLATMALLQQTPDTSTLEDARAAAERSLLLAPENAWSQEAMAWVEYVAGDCVGALARSERAMQLSPLDPHIVEFEALIGLFCGEFDRVISETEAILETLGQNPGFVFTNALGSARFHKGDDLGTIAAFETSIMGGGPTGPISAAYLMAAHHRLGRQNQAVQIAERFEASWPDMPIDRVFERLFDDPRFAQELVEAMRGAGWSGGR